MPSPFRSGVFVTRQDGSVNREAENLGVAPFISQVDRLPGRRISPEQIGLTVAIEVGCPVGCHCRSATISRRTVATVPFISQDNSLAGRRVVPK